MTKVETASDEDQATRAAVSDDGVKSTKPTRARDILISTMIVMTQLVQVRTVSLPRPCGMYVPMERISQLISTQMMPYGAGVNGGLEIGRRLGAEPTQAIWITASYP
jgi:hypothetical protein